MKIAIDIREVFGPRAGKGEYTWGILKGLLAIDQQNNYFLYSRKKARIRGGNVKLRAINLPKFIWHFWVYLDLRLRTRPDFYLSPTSYIIPALGVLNSVIIVPDLVAFLFSSQHNKKAVFLERTFLKPALKKSRKIIAISQSTKRDLVSKFGIDPRKVRVVYLGADKCFHKIAGQDSRLALIREKYGLSRKFILFVGTLEPRKNLVRLIRAYRRLKIQGFDLVIAGRKGWHYRDILLRVNELELQDRVRFLGYLPKEDLPFLYNLASVFVFPSLYEGFGLPPLEAIACGTPVIASRTSSLPEVVGRAGLLVNPKSVSEIKEALEEVLTDTVLRDKLIRLGLLQAKRFSWEKTAREILKVVQSLRF